MLVVYIFSENYFSQIYQLGNFVIFIFTDQEIESKTNDLFRFTQLVISPVKMGTLVCLTTKLNSSLDHVAIEAEMLTQYKLLFFCAAWKESQFAIIFGLNNILKPYLTDHNKVTVCVC